MFSLPSVAQVPHEMITQSRNSYVDAEVHSPTLDELGKQVDEEGGNYQMYLETLMQNLQKEAKEKFKGWVTCSSVENTELAYKKVIWGDMKQAVKTKAKCSSVMGHPGMLHGKTHTLLSGKALLFYYYFQEDY